MSLWSIFSALWIRSNSHGLEFLSFSFVSYKHRVKCFMKYTTLLLLFSSLFDAVVAVAFARTQRFNRRTPREAGPQPTAPIHFPVFSLSFTFLVSFISIPLLLHRHRLGFFMYTLFGSASQHRSSLICSCLFILAVDFNILSNHFFVCVCCWLLRWGSLSCPHFSLTERFMVGGVIQFKTKRPTRSYLIGSAAIWKRIQWKQIVREFYSRPIHYRAEIYFTMSLIESRSPNVPQ